MVCRLPNDVELVRTTIRALVEDHFPGSQPDRYGDDVHRVIGIDNYARDDLHDLRVFFPPKGESEEKYPVFITANHMIPSINNIENELNSSGQALSALRADLNRLFSGNEKGVDITIKNTGPGQEYVEQRPKVSVLTHSEESSLGILIYGGINELASAIRRNIKREPRLRNLLDQASPFSGTNL